MNIRNEEYVICRLTDSHDFDYILRIPMFKWMKLLKVVTGISWKHFQLCGFTLSRLLLIAFSSNLRTMIATLLEMLLRLLLILKTRRWKIARTTPKLLELSEEKEKYCQLSLRSFVCLFVQSFHFCFVSIPKEKTNLRQVTVHMRGKKIQLLQSRYSNSNKN